MYVLGMDIGYSNLKQAQGEKGGPVTQMVRPAGAGPVEALPQQVIGTDPNCIHVTVEGEQWVAGVEPRRLQGWERELHADYPSTKQYRALFHAALLLAEQREIDRLVTGLPVSQHMDAAQRERLQKMLTGEHQITPKRVVTVKEVLVVPQPAGAYMHVVNTTKDEDLLEVFQEGRTIVIDPGFFSVDWVALEAGEIRYQSSGTSLKAMSVMLEEVDKLIQPDHGGSVGVEKIEQAIRAGRPDVFLFGEKVALAPYLEKAAEKVADAALTSMRKSLREEGMEADVVLLAGGGATTYQAAAKALFPQSRVITPEVPVAANASGFWFCG